jgi:hypothetical protein
MNVISPPWKSIYAMRFTQLIPHISTPMDGNDHIRHPIASMALPAVVLGV